MGRKITNKPDAPFRYKQICLKGQVLKMFEYDREKRNLTESELGEKIIKEYYTTKPPLGFFKD